MQHENSSFNKDSNWLIRQSKEGKPIDEQLTSVSDNIKVARRKCLMEQLKVLRLLARQGIASNSDISKSNLVQLILLNNMLPFMVSNPPHFRVYMYFKNYRKSKKSKKIALRARG